MFDKHVDEFDWVKDHDMTSIAKQLLSVQPEALSNGLGMEKIVLDKHPEWHFEKRNATIGNSRILVTRACVRDAYDEALRQMGVPGIPPPCSVPPGSTAVVPPLSPINRAVIMGNEGTGKRFGLFHALRRLLAAGKVVVYNCARLQLFHAFIPARMEVEVSVHNAEAKGFDKLTKAVWAGKGEPEEYKVYSCHSDTTFRCSMLHCNEVFYLLDPDEDSRFAFIRACTLVSCSMDEDRCNEYMKMGAMFYYLPTFTLPEAKRILKADALGDVDEQEVEEKFYIVGGNLRALAMRRVLSYYASDIYRKATDEISRNGLACTYEARGRWPLITNSPTHKTNSAIFSYESSYPFDLKNVRPVFVSECARYELEMHSYHDLYARGSMAVGTCGKPCA